MKKYLKFLGIFVIVGIWTVTLVSWVAAQQKGNSSQLNSSDQQQAAPGSDSNPTGPFTVDIPKEYKSDGAAPASTDATVYFTPQDENTSTTVLFLYNTNPLTSTVSLKTYYINGSLTISTTLSVPANGLLRICSDTVSTVSASWSKYVLVNFTTFSAYAKMTLPIGVKADGYVAWDTTGVYDPLNADITLPIRFSADPATIFLPTLRK